MERVLTETRPQARRLATTATTRDKFRAKVRAVSRAAGRATYATDTESDTSINALELFAKSCYAHSRYKEAEDLFAQASRAREKLHQPALPENVSRVVDGGLRVPPSIGHTVPDAMMFDPDVQRSVNNVAAAGAAAVKHDRKRRRRAKKKRQARAAARAAAIRRDDHRYLMSRPRRMTSL